MVKFILIKSPDEWATTKQACRDELVVYLFFYLIYIFVELDYLVEDIYCYSEFHAPSGAIIRQLPKLTDTKDDVQNLKIQNNAY